MAEPHHHNIHIFIIKRRDGRRGIHWSAAHDAHLMVVVPERRWRALVKMKITYDSYLMSKPIETFSSEHLFPHFSTHHSQLIDSQSHHR